MFHFEMISCKKTLTHMCMEKWGGLYELFCAIYGQCTATTGYLITVQCVDRSIISSASVHFKSQQRSCNHDWTIWWYIANIYHRQWVVMNISYHVIIDANIRCARFWPVVVWINLVAYLIRWINQQTLYGCIQPLPNDAAILQPRTHSLCVLSLLCVHLCWLQHRCHVWFDTCVIIK